MGFEEVWQISAFKRFFDSTRNLLIVCVCFVAGLLVTQYVVVLTTQNWKIGVWVSMFCNLFHSLSLCICFSTAE